VINESINYLINVILHKDSLYNEDNILSPYEVAMLYNPKDVIESLKLCSKIFGKIKSIEDDLLKVKEFSLKPSADCGSINNCEIGKYFS
jgi:hypothetical protein